MPAFFITIYGMVRAVYAASKEPEFRHIFYLLLIVLGIGVYFYSKVEGWSYIDSFYFTIITLSTVGYGDIAPKTDVGKIFTVVYIIIGFGIFVTFVTQLGLKMMEYHQTKSETGRTGRRALGLLRRRSSENHEGNEES